MRKTALILMGMALAAPAPVHPASWPAFRHNPEREGRTREQAYPPLTARWQAELEDEAVSSPVVAYGKVYAASRSGHIFAFDAFTGEEVWNYSSDDWVDSTPAVSEGRVFIVSRIGAIHALDAETGDLLWTYKTDSHDVASPVVVGSELVAACGFPDRRILVLDVETGTLIRSATLDKFLHSSPTVDKDLDLLWVGSGDGKFSAFKFSTLGSPLWQYSGKGNIYYHTMARGGNLVIGSPGDDDRKVYAFQADASGPTVLWSSSDLCANAMPISSPVTDDTNVYINIGCSTQKLHALKLSDGTAAWGSPRSLGTVGEFGFLPSPALANDVIYTGANDGNLYAIKAADGSVLGTYPVGGPVMASPAVSNGWVYISTRLGRLYAFEASKVSAIGSPDPHVSGEVHGTVTLQGYVQNPDLKTYTVEVGKGASPASWAALSSGSTAVNGGTLASWDTTSLEEGQYTIRMSVEENTPSGVDGVALAPFLVVQEKFAAISVSSGATLSLADGTELIIPPGAVTGEKRVRMRRLFSGYSNVGIPEGISASNQVRRLTVDGEDKPRFLKPLTLKFPWSEAVPAPRKPENLRVYFFDTTINRWVVVNESEVDKDEQRVHASFDHFTDFRLMEFVPDGTLLKETQVYTYPNPARGDALTFKFYMGDTSNVRVRIFDVAGDLVDTLYKDNILGGTAGEITWNIRDKASGVYVYIMEATTAAGQKGSVTKKLAIVH